VALSSHKKTALFALDIGRAPMLPIENTTLLQNAEREKILTVRLKGEFLYLDQ